MQKELSDILPLFGVEHDMILSKMGDITIGFVLELPEIFTLSDADYESLHQAWVKAVKLLPVGSVLHKQDWYVQTGYVGDFEKDHSFLSRASERFFNERPYLKHSCYLFLTLRPSDRKPVTSLFSSLLRRHIVPKETLDPAFAKSFEASCSQFVKLLGDSGFIRVRRLEENELVDLVNRYLVLSEDGVVRDLSFDNGIRIGEKFCELFTLAGADNLPAFCGPRINYDKYESDATKFSVGFVSPLCQLLPINHIFNQYLFIEDGGATLKKLEAKKRRLQSLSAYSRENSFARDAVDSFLSEAVAENRIPVKAHFNVLAWTPDAAQIQALRNKCISAFSQIDAVPKIETVGAPQIYWAGIPGNAADMPVNETIDIFSAQACCFINMETSYRSSASPTGLRLGDRISGQPLQVDLSDEPMKHGIISNRNKFIIGPSGSGKSFFTNHLLRSYYEQGTHVVLVDVGHSYKGLCDLVGGYYFTYSEQSYIKFNPFYIEEGDMLDVEKRESIKTLLVALWKKDHENFTRSEYVALSNALQLYYEKVVAVRSFNSFYEFLRDEFSNAITTDRVKEKDFDISNFLYVLRPYYSGGEYDYLLNAEENLNLLNQRFIVFELDTVKDHPILLPVITIIVMQLFISKMRKLKGVRKIILIEEAWKAIAREGMAEFIKYLFKTVRKHFGEAIVVTQEIEDIISSTIVKQAIIGSSDCKILLDQSKYQHQFDTVQELLGLTEKQKAQILSLNKANEPGRKYKEVFISLGTGVSKVYRVEVSPEEYLMYTTEEKEKMEVVKATEKLGSVEAAVRELVANAD